MYFVRYIKRFDIKRSKSKRDLLQTGLTDILLLVTSLIAGVVTARLLGPEGRGQLAVVMLWPSLFAAVGSLGVRDALVYEQARAIQPKAVLTGVAIVLASLQSFFIILIGWFLIPILTKSQSSEIVVLTKQYLIFIFLNLTSLYMGALLQGKLRIALYNLVRLSVSVVYTLGLLTLWMFDSFNVQNVAYVLLIANAFTTLLAFIINLIDSGVSLHFHLSLFYSIFTYGIKNHIGSISHMFNERLDQMVLALLLTPKELGWYVVAVSAANIAKVAASPFSQLIFPRLAGQDLDNQRQIVRIHSRYTLLSTLLLILFLSLALPYLIPVIYGGDFSPSIKSAQVLTFAAFFLGIGLVWRQALSGMGKPLVASQAEILSLLVTAVGLYFFIPIYGVLGAAWVSLTAYALAAIYLGLKLKQSLNVSWSLILGG